MVNRDYYQLLGVQQDASTEEIRSAYRKRISVIHPDRFDPARQPEQWQAANEMLMELNSAYGILHHPGKRASYDERRGASPPPRVALPAVRSRFKDLPQATQERLLVLQKGRSQFFKLQSHMPVNVFKFKTGDRLTTWCGWLSAALLLTLCALLSYPGGRLNLSQLILISGPMSVAFAVAAYRLVRWYRSPIKDYIYLTPLYYIRTRPGHVTFRWLWSSDTLVVKPMTNRRTSQSGGVVVLGFDNRPEKIKLGSEATAREVAYALGVWEKLIRDLEGERSKLLDQLDAFPEISARLGKRSAPEATATEAARPTPIDDGSSRTDTVALQPECFYVKGW